MNIFITDHAAQRALKRGDIADKEYLWRLYKEGKPISKRQLQRQGLWRGDDSHELTRINGQHIFYASKMKSGGIKIKTYIRKEKHQRYYGRRQIDKRNMKYDRHRDVHIQKVDEGAHQARTGAVDA